jgi:hypothetical protein
MRHVRAKRCGHRAIRFKSSFREALHSGLSAAIPCRGFLRTQRNNIHNFKHYQSTKKSKFVQKQTQKWSLYLEYPSMPTPLS